RPPERAALDRLPVDVGAVKAELGLEELDDPVERGFAERLAAFPTLTINGLHGGYGGQGTQTILPSVAVAKCDARLVHAQRAADVYDKLEAHVRRHAPGVELVRQGSMEPSRTPMGSPFTAPIREGMAAAQGADPLLVPPLGGSPPAHGLRAGPPSAPPTRPTTPPTRTSTWSGSTPGSRRPPPCWRNSVYWSGRLPAPWPGEHLSPHRPARTPAPAWPARD